MAGVGRIRTSVAANGDVKKTHQYKVTVYFDIGFDWGGYNYNGASYSITCNGSTQSGSNTFAVASNGGASYSYANLGSKTFTITMDKSGASKTISISATCSTGVNPATITASKSLTLTAVTW